MKRTLLIALFTILVSGVGYGQQQTMINSPGGVQSAGDATRAAYGIAINLFGFQNLRSSAGRGADVLIEYRGQRVTMSFAEFFRRVGLRYPRHAHAQQPQKPDPQAEFKAAQKRLSDAETAKDAALSAFAAALADRNAILWRMMAESSVKPSQCAAEGNPFACVRADPKTGDISFTPKPAEQPKEKQ